MCPRTERDLTRVSSPLPSLHRDDLVGLRLSVQWRYSFATTQWPFVTCRRWHLLRSAQSMAPHHPRPRAQEYMERLRIQKSAGVQGDRTFDFLAANVAKVERDERRQLDALQNGEQRVCSARAFLLVAVL